MDPDSTGEVDAGEVAASLTLEDWKGLERRVNSHVGEWTLPISGIVMTLAFPVMALGTWFGFSPLLGFVMFVPAGVVFYAGRRMMEKGIEDHRLFSELLREELTSGVRIIPEWFRIEDKVVSTGLYRGPPDYTDTQWEKLTGATRAYGWRFLLFFIPYMLAFGLILGLPSFLGIAEQWTLVALAPLLWTVIIWATILACQTQKVSNLLALEELTGREFIPERHKARIGRTWLKMQKEIEERLAREIREM